MLSVIKRGDYRLAEANGRKYLYLDEAVYRWFERAGHELLVISSSRRPDEPRTLAGGPYRLYDAEDDYRFTGGWHLELWHDDGSWQGYLLPTELPGAGKQGATITKTSERITSPYNGYAGRGTLALRGD